MAVQEAAHRVGRFLCRLPAALADHPGWRPSGWRATIIQMSIGLIGLQRGAVYATQSGDNPSLSVIERVFPIHWIGWAFLFYGACATIGPLWAWKWPRAAAGAVTALGHLGLSACYLTIGTGIIEAVGMHQVSGDPFNDPLIAAIASIIIGIGVHPLFFADISVGAGIARGIRRIGDR
jgi:hypothetical protein